MGRVVPAHMRRYGSMEGDDGGIVQQSRLANNTAVEELTLVSACCGFEHHQGQT